MKLGLLGYPIDHSLSPALYSKLLGNELTSYEKFSYKHTADVPVINFFAEKLDGLNITSPYKRHFLQDVVIPDETVRELGAINTIVFKDKKSFATNTDYLAVVDILKNYQNRCGRIHLLILGDGAMARMTKIVAANEKVTFDQFSRRLTLDFPKLDLRPHYRPDSQTIIVNSCSRDFTFTGPLTGNEIFWDYNYSFPPHEDSLPSRVKEYYDGREMLELQAVAAIKFWKSYI